MQGHPGPWRGCTPPTPPMVIFGSSRFREAPSVKCHSSCTISLRQASQICIVEARSFQYNAYAPVALAAADDEDALRSPCQRCWAALCQAAAPRPFGSAKVTSQAILDRSFHLACESAQRPMPFSRIHPILRAFVKNKTWLMCHITYVNVSAPWH